MGNAFEIAMFLFDFCPDLFSDLLQNIYANNVKISSTNAATKSQNEQPKVTTHVLSLGQSISSPNLRSAANTTSSDSVKSDTLCVHLVVFVYSLLYFSFKTNCLLVLFIYLFFGFQIG